MIDIAADYRMADVAAQLGWLRQHVSNQIGINVAADFPNKVRVFGAADGNQHLWISPDIPRAARVARDIQRNCGLLCVAEDMGNPVDPYWIAVSRLARDEVMPRTCNAILYLYLYVNGIIT